ncbi:MAG: ATP synthase F0 subunit B [Deltaproteobacteria bacterium]|nr:ATP synthase F0 subunit B [Deltaproteobacteria bacterium]
MKRPSILTLMPGQRRPVRRLSKHSNKCVCLLTASVLVLACFGTAVWAAGERADYDAGLGPLAWSIGNFALLVYILYRFGGRRLYAYLKERQESIRSTLEIAEKTKDEAEEKARIYREKLESVEEEIQRLIAEVREEGEKEKNRIIESAQEAVRLIKRETRRAAEEEVNRTAALLRKEMLTLSVRLAEDIVRQNLTPEDQRRLVRCYLDQMAELS